MRKLLPVPAVFQNLHAAGEPVMMSRSTNRKRSGVGAILMRLFKQLGFDAGESPEIDRHIGNVTLAGCGTCHQVADLMDDEGPDWCEANADALVAKIRENAAKKKVPLFGTADKLPGFEWAVRNRLKRAIELARANVTDQ